MPLHDDRISFVHLLRRAAQAADEAFVREVGSLTPRQYVVLVCVGENEGLKQTDIMERTGVDHSTIADLMQRMVRKKLLRRQRRKDDTRAYNVRLTDAGREALSQAERKVRRAEALVLSGLRADRRDAFLERLAVICRR
jgi:DNA-binding MarR family transcriptional regulator